MADLRHCFITERSSSEIASFDWSQMRTQANERLQAPHLLEFSSDLSQSSLSHEVFPSVSLEAMKFHCLKSYAWNNFDPPSPPG